MELKKFSRGSLPHQLITDTGPSHTGTGKAPEHRPHGRSSCIFPEGSADGDQQAHSCSCQQRVVCRSCPGERWGLSETTRGLPYAGGRCDEPPKGRDSASTERQQREKGRSEGSMSKQSCQGKATPRPSRASVMGDALQLQPVMREWGHLKVLYEIEM